MLTIVANSVVAMRVVLDTNVLISACLKPDGLEAEVVRLARSGAVELCLTDAIEREYREVFERPKFAALRESASSLLVALGENAARVSACERLQLASDEDDNRFLECALAARADYLVTGNLRHYPSACGSTQIGNARGFLNDLEFGTGR